MGSYTLTWAPDSCPDSLFSVLEPKEIRGYVKFMHDKNLRMEKLTERGKTGYLKMKERELVSERGKSGPGEQISLQSSEEKHNDVKCAAKKKKKKDLSK